MTKKLLALALSLVLTANIAACNYHDNEESSSQPSSSAPSSSDVASSDNVSSEESTISSSKPSSGRPNIDGSQDGFKNNIPEPEPENPDDDSDKDGGSVNDQFEGQIVVVPELTLAAGKTVNVSGQNAFTYKTATWNGPKGYALVIPYGDAEARRIAELVRNYFYYSTGTNLNISYDTVLTEGEKEILVGKTNRKDSNKNLKENEFNVRVSGKKLIFEAGHNATLETAVHRFFGIGISETVVPTFTCKNDFTSTLSFLSGYQYVWGDEFEGNELDFTKWSLDQKMGGFKDLQVSTGRDVIKVGDGRLTLSAIHKPNASKPYVVPCSTTTMRHMNFIYGYCEIRAKVPFYTGVWPSFWTQSTDVVSSKYGVYRTKNYFVEVDVFEVFGNKNTVVPNLHKWYDKNYYNYGEIHGIPGSTHSSSGTDKNFYLNASTANNDYHTYGWEWTPTEMSMFVDGVKYKTYDITKSFDKNPDMTGFHDPEFVMFNNHVFTPESSFKPNLITGNEKVLPANYDIDYFRLYQKNDGRSKLYLDRAVTGPYDGR